MERGIITITENGTVTMPTVPVWMTQQEMSDATSAGLYMPSTRIWNCLKAIPCATSGKTTG